MSNGDGSRAIAQGSASRTTGHPSDASGKRAPPHNLWVSPLGASPQTPGFIAFVPIPETTWANHFRPAMNNRQLTVSGIGINATNPGVWGRAPVSSGWRLPTHSAKEPEKQTRQISRKTEGQARNCASRSSRLRDGEPMLRPLLFDISVNLRRNKRSVPNASSRRPDQNKGNIRQRTGSWILRNSVAPASRASGIEQ